MTVEDSAADPTNVTDGGMTGEHPTRHALPVLVAPSLGSELNTIRHPLTPIACWPLGDVRFEFDSSFVKPEVRTETPLLAALLEKHATTERPSMSIFGHTDPVGNDDFNKVLSGRRARAIHALLTRDAAAWEELFTSAVGSDAWGTVTIDVMLATVGEGSMTAMARRRTDPRGHRHLVTSRGRGNAVKCQASHVRLERLTTELRWPEPARARCSPLAPIDVRETHIADARLDPVDPREPGPIEIAILHTAVRERELERLAGHGIAILVEQDNLDERLQNRCRRALRQRGG